jgi:hypothetical protein
MIKYQVYLPDIKIIYNRLKQSAKKRNISFDLTITQLNDLTFPITCPVLGIPLKFNRGQQQDDSYSIDRIDSTLGYTIDNIEVISWRANRLKNNATTEELQKLSKHCS